MTKNHPFIIRSNLRTFSPDSDEQDLFVWDIDKTYLDTRFSSLRGLAAIPFEFAVDKRAIPGAVPLLRAIRRGPGDKHRVTPLYFVSGSPPQLRRVVERKMMLDGVQFDGITFKDQWAFVRARRPKGIKEQVGYKLRALLLYRNEIRTIPNWFAFGDDAESDAKIFPLFGEVCAGLRGPPLIQRLKKLGVHSKDIRNVEEILEKTPLTDNPMRGVFIHLYNKTDPEKFSGEGMYPTKNFLQTAMVLARLGKIQPQAVRAVASRFVREASGNAIEPERIVEDAVNRFGSFSDEIVSYALDRQVDSRAS